MDASDIKTTARSWSQHLSTIPINRIRDVYAATVIGAKFPPAVADFAETWRTIHGDEIRAQNSEAWKRRDDAVREKMPQLPPGSYAGGADTRQAPAFVRQHVTFLKRNGGAVTCDCAGDRFGKPAARLEETNWGRVWKCARNQCDFSAKAEQLMNEMPLPAITNFRGEYSPVAASIACEYSDDEIKLELEARCEFDVTTNSARALRFARRLQNKCPVDLWSNAIARSEWQKFQDDEAAREYSRAEHAEAAA